MERTISSTLKCQLPSNVEKLTFWRLVRPNPGKVRRKSCVCSVRSPRTPPDLKFNLNYIKNSFCVKLEISRFTNRRLVIIWKNENCRWWAFGRFAWQSLIQTWPTRSVCVFPRVLYRPLSAKILQFVSRLLLVNLENRVLHKNCFL